MSHQPRLFDHAEASALIPVLRPLLRSLQEQKREHDELRKRLEPYSAAMRTNGHATAVAPIEGRIAELIDAMHETVQEIQNMGVEVKDLDMGLVDFPALRDDRIVYLCWMVDEPEIAFWHDLDTGIAGREPL